MWTCYLIQNGLQGIKDHRLIEFGIVFIKKIVLSMRLNYTKFSSFLKNVIFNKDTESGIKMEIDKIKILV